MPKLVAVAAVVRDLVRDPAVVSRGGPRENFCTTDRRHALVVLLGSGILPTIGRRDRARTVAASNALVAVPGGPVKTVAVSNVPVVAAIGQLALAKMVAEFNDLAVGTTGPDVPAKMGVALSVPAVVTTVPADRVAVVMIDLDVPVAVAMIVPVALETMTIALADQEITIIDQDDLVIDLAKVVAVSNGDRAIDDPAIGPIIGRIEFQIAIVGTTGVGTTVTSLGTTGIIIGTTTGTTATTGTTTTGGTAMVGDTRTIPISTIGATRRGQR